MAAILPNWRSLDDLLGGDRVTSITDLRTLRRVRDAAQREGNRLVAAEACVRLGELAEAGVHYVKAGMMAEATQYLDHASQQGNNVATEKLFDMYMHNRTNHQKAKRLFLRDAPEDLELLARLAQDGVTLYPREVNVVACAWEEDGLRKKDPNAKISIHFNIGSLIKKGHKNLALKVGKQAGYTAVDVTGNLDGIIGGIYALVKPSDLLGIYTAEEVIRGYLTQVEKCAFTKLNDDWTALEPISETYWDRLTIGRIKNYLVEAGLTKTVQNIEQYAEPEDRWEMKPIEEIRPVLFGFVREELSEAYGVTAE